MSFSPEHLAKMAQFLRVERVVELGSPSRHRRRLMLEVAGFVDVVEFDDLDLRVACPERILVFRDFVDKAARLRARSQLEQARIEQARIEQARIEQARIEQARRAALIEFISSAQEIQLLSMPQEIEFVPLQIDLGEKLYSEYLANISASAAATYGMPRDVIDGGESRPVVRDRFDAIALEMTEDA